MDTHAGCATPPVGCCYDMCPEKERTERERNRRLSIFEIFPGTENSKKPKANPLTCVKEYSRSAAGREIIAANLRPPKVLLSTVDYLINDIVDQDKHSRTWLEIYNFVSDRIHAVVQDMIIQRTNASTSIRILQKAVRFHILFMHMLQNTNDFDQKLCFEQLCAYLASLLTYNESTESAAWEKWDEFTGYHALLHFNTEHALQYFLLQNNFSSSCKYHSIVKLSLSNCLSNFVSLFRLAEKLPFISSCCFSQHINVLRFNAIKIICTAYSGRNTRFAIATLAEWLKFDSINDAAGFCEKLGLDTKDGFVTFSKSVVLSLDSTKIVEELNKSHCLVEAKKESDIKYYINNGETYD